MNKTTVVRLSLYSVIMWMVFSCPGSSIAWGEGIKIDAETDITIQLKLVTEQELSVLFGSRSERRSDDLYLFGSVTNKNGDSAFIKLEVTSPNNPTIRVRDIGVGWIPPKGLRPVYFLRYLMNPILRTSVPDVQLEYKILSVVRK